VEVQDNWNGNKGLNSNTKAGLLYASDSWTITQSQMPTNDCKYTLAGQNIQQ